MPVIPVNKRWWTGKELLEKGSQGGKTQGVAAPPQKKNPLHIGLNMHCHLDFQKSSGMEFDP
jgi:hypothetical protein